MVASSGEHETNLGLVHVDTILIPKEQKLIPEIYNFFFIIVKRLGTLQTH